MEFKPSALVATVCDPMEGARSLPSPRSSFGILPAARPLATTSEAASLRRALASTTLTRTQLHR